MATYLSNGTAHWVHVGDTRFYVFRQGRLVQVTTDPTTAQRPVEEGGLTPDEARSHPYPGSTSHASVEAVAEALIQAALDSGGQENMTLVLASV